MDIGGDDAVRRELQAGETAREEEAQSAVAKQQEDHDEIDRRHLPSPQQAQEAAERQQRPDDGDAGGKGQGRIALPKQHEDIGRDDQGKLPGKEQPGEIGDQARVHKKIAAAEKQRQGEDAQYRDGPVLTPAFAFE